MGKASWANQSFKKADRKKYADGGSVDLSSSDYADNSSGTWGAMGNRAMQERNDESARRDIERATPASYDDKTDLTDSFRDRTGQDDDTAKKIEAMTPAKYDDTPPPSTKPAAKRAAPKPTNEDQNDRALRRANNRTPTKVVDYGDEAARMARRYPKKPSKLLPVVRRAMPGSKFLDNED